MGTVEKTIKSEEGLTVFTVRGSVAVEQIKQVIRDFYARGPVTLNVLWSLLQAQLRGFSTADVLDIASVQRRPLLSCEGGKTAIVAADDLVFGLSRIYQVSSSSNELPFETRVFRDPAEARQWLGEKDTGGEG